MSETEFARAERYWREVCQLETENKKLQEKLDVAVEALEDIAYETTLKGFENKVDQEIALDALSKIRGEK